MSEVDRAFTGSIPEIYERCLGPMLFEPFAEHVAAALGLAELQRGGAAFAYPNGLTPLEWATLNGLTRGKDRAEGLKADRDRKEARKKKR